MPNVVRHLSDVTTNLYPPLNGKKKMCVESSAAALLCSRRFDRYLSTALYMMLLFTLFRRLSLAIMWLGGNHCTSPRLEGGATCSISGAPTSVRVMTTAWCRAYTTWSMAQVKRASNMQGHLLCREKKKERARRGSERTFMLRRSILFFEGDPRLSIDDDIKSAPYSRLFHMMAAAFPTSAT